MFLLRLRWDEHFAEHQGIEDGQDMFAIGQHPVDHAMVHRVALRQALPAFENVGGNVDILAQLLQRVAAQKQAVEEGRFVLRFGKLEIRSAHILNTPNAILPVKNPGALAKFFGCALEQKHNHKPVVKSPSVFMRV